MKKQVAAMTVLALMLAWQWRTSAAELEWARKEKGRHGPGASSQPSLRVGVAFIPEFRVTDETAGYGKTSMMEMEVHSIFFDYSNKTVGDIDMNLAGDGVVYFDETEADLPGQLARIALDMGWAKRYGERFESRIRAMPGIYSDFEEFDTDAFHIPFSAALVRVYSPTVLGTIGLDVRPGFERPLIPRVGLIWEPSDAFRLEAMLPESKAVWVLSDNWRMHAGLVWNNMDYTLDDGDGDNRGSVTVEDFRVSLSLTRCFSDQVRLTGEVGEIFERSVEFHGDGEPDSEFDMENALLIRVSLSGPF